MRHFGLSGNTEYRTLALVNHIGVFILRRATYAVIFDAVRRATYGVCRATYVVCRATYAVMYQYMIHI